MTLPMTRVCAIVVTFRPPVELISNIDLLLEQVDHAILVDNTGISHHGKVLEDLATRRNLSILHNESNEGIATALNQGIKRGIEMGYRWLITFDQDSTVGVGMVNILLHCFENAPLVAIAAPAYIDRASGRQLGEDRDSSGEVRTVLSSGMLLPAWIFDRVGWMDEALFIDSVDLEFCRRVRRMGYRIVQSGEARLIHSLGRLAEFRILGRRFEATNHSAARKYYQMRNRLWTLGRPRLSKAWWGEGLREIKSIAWDTCKVILVEDDKWNKLRRIVQGAWDAVTGRMGKRVQL